MPRWLRIGAVITAAIVEHELDLPKADRPAAAPREDALSTAIERHVLSLLKDESLGSLPSEGLYASVLEQMERPLLSAVLAATRGNQIRAAKILGLNRNTLRKKLKGLDVSLVHRLK